MHRLVISAVLVLCVGSFSVRAYRLIGRDLGFEPTPLRLVQIREFGV
jgi:hypothetical protein